MADNEIDVMLTEARNTVRANLERARGERLQAERRLNVADHRVAQLEDVLAKLDEAIEIQGETE